MRQPTHHLKHWVASIYSNEIKMFVTRANLFLKRPPETRIISPCRHFSPSSMESSPLYSLTNRNSHCSSTGFAIPFGLSRSFHRHRPIRLILTHLGNQVPERGGIPTATSRERRTRWASSRVGCTSRQLGHFADSPNIGYPLIRKLL